MIEEIIENMDQMTKAQGISEELRQLFSLKRISITKGGPSAIDPMGEVSWYLGLLDAEGNGFHVGVDDVGRVVRCGATLKGRAYRIPVEETVNG